MPSPATIGIWATDDITWEGKSSDIKVSVNPVFVGYDFFKTFGMEIVQGRSFSRDLRTDETAAYILNEKAVGSLGLQSPIGKQLTLDGNVGMIIGVVKNFHHNSLHNPIDPLVLQFAPSESQTIFIRIKSSDVISAIDTIRDSWKEVEPDYPMEYNFFDQTIENQYRSEMQVGRLFNGFAVFAILITCLGLLGLSSFMAEQRTKEIGIRKVMGASVPRVVQLLCREFILLILIANVIALPIVTISLNRWLQNFAYRIDMNVSVFLISTCLVLGIALLTVGFQSIRAAIANPVDALRYE
jgi:ABC-type antimicrobial peptide transport system permease subunit